MASVWQEYGITMATPCQTLAKLLSMPAHTGGSGWPRRWVDHPDGGST